MPRPLEYENLIRIGSLKEAATTNESIAQFLQIANEMLSASQASLPNSAAFLCGYEGMFSVVMAVLEFHGVRPGDGGGHRAIAIGLVATELKLDASMQSALGRLHDTRNRLTYRQPIPRLTAADVAAMRSILETLLPAAKRLTSP